MRRPFSTCASSLAAFFLFFSAPARAGAPVQPLEIVDESQPMISGSKKDDARWIAELGRCVEIIKDSDRKLAGSGLSSKQAKKLRERRALELSRLEATGREQDANYKAQVYLARAFLSVSRPRRALRPAERAVYLAPSDHEAHILRGLARLGVGDKPEAAAEARSILAVEPENKGAKDLLRLAGEK